MEIRLVAVNGSYVHTNLAVRCLRRTLEGAGFSVGISEFSLRDRTEHILEALYSENAGIYGFSVYIWNLPVCLTLARELKKLNPGCRVILGGPEVSYETDRFDGMDFIDCIIRGEGEDAIVRVCRDLESGRDVPRIIDGGIAEGVMSDEGILYRDGEITGNRLLYYESSRGCPFGCAYCLSSATEGVRMKDIPQVLDDLREFERFSGRVKVIKFVDRSFNADPKRANAIWEALLSPEFTLKYHFEVCASLLNEESFEILSRFPAGKIQLEVGLQSANREVLAASARHLDPDKVISASRRIRDMGNIEIYVDLIAGLPFEDMESFGRSFDAAYFCSTRLQVGFLKLLPGTALRRDADKYGYICLSEPPYTVLASAWMSFCDMAELTRIHELMERYCESGAFCRSLGAVYKSIKSPFAFWRGYAEYLKNSGCGEIQKLPQPDAYIRLAEYAGTDVPGLCEALCGDFLAHEHKTPPFGLRRLAGSGA